jgi:excisionase family DNA binding protein
MTDELLKNILIELQAIRENGDSSPEVLDVHQAAQFLSISEFTLREWCRLRKIPHSRINRQYRFRRSVLLKWLDSSEIPTMN